MRLQIACAGSCMDGQAALKLYDHMQENLRILKGEQAASGEPQHQIALSEAELRRQLEEA